VRLPLAEAAVDTGAGAERVAEATPG
jgi:hypothetical protein